MYFCYCGTYLVFLSCKVKESNVALQNEIDDKRAEIKTEEYGMSFGELINLYKSKEIDIHPEFQRYFRWDSYQKTRFIESILLGIPIPPIFVAQQPNGIWDVVDGLQRLATIFQFVGILKDENDQLVEPVVLEKTKDLPSLAGKKWEDEAHPENAFTFTEQLLIKRAHIGISIILRESDLRTKFELFQRLNTGGSALTDQEVRNSILVRINHYMFTWMRDLSIDENFQTTIAMSDRQLQEQYDIELLLRFLAFRTLSKNEITRTNIGDLSEFLTDQMWKMAENPNFDYEEEERAFRHTFRVLAATTSEDTFKRYDKDKKRFTGAFLVTPFEVVALGLGYNYAYWDENKSDMILEKIKSVWKNKEVLNNSGSGIRASTRIPKTIPVGRKLFAHE